MKNMLKNSCLALMALFLFAFQVNAQKASDKVDVVFVGVEEMPEYLDGQKAMMKYFEENQIFTEEAKKAQVNARATVQFIVEKDGTISGAKILRGAGYGLDEDTLRLINSLPAAWKPGYQNGEAVRCYFTVPIVYNYKG